MSMVPYFHLRECRRSRLSRTVTVGYDVFYSTLERPRLSLSNGRLLAESQYIPLQSDQLPVIKACVATSLQACVRPPTMEFFQRFSSLQRMLRVLFYCMRFIDRLRKRPLNWDSVSSIERNRALVVVILRTQEVHFSDLLKQLTAGKLVSPVSVARLAPFIDPNGVIRVGGRLRFSAFNEDAKHLSHPTVDLALSPELHAWWPKARVIHDLSTLLNFVIS